MSDVLLLLSFIALFFSLLVLLIAYRAENRRDNQTPDTAENKALELDDGESA